MGRILLVEDDDPVRAFVTRALAMDGHRVVEAEDGLEGLDRYRDGDGEFDLVLTDIQMPGLDGIEMSKQVAAKNPDQKILIMTGYANQRERAGEVSRIVIDVIQKPFSLSELRAHVVSALAG